jgi:hypothetical protein
MLKSCAWNGTFPLKGAESELPDIEATQLCNDFTECRLAVRKSKSVGYDTTYRHHDMLRVAFREPETVQNTGMPISYRNNRIETRTVKSDTCLSPRKPKRIDLVEQSDHRDAKKSPASVLEFGKQSSHHRSTSEKKSFSNHGSSVLEILSGYSNSHRSNRATFNLSSCFSNDDESEGSSFANDDIASFPTTVRISLGSGSMPSDLTASLDALAISASSPIKTEERPPLKHIASRLSIDVIPRPPRRKSSDRDFCTGGQTTSRPHIPQQIQCFPMDESPLKPSRQRSDRKLDRSSSSLLTKLSSFDLSPKKPQRHNSHKSSDSEFYNTMQSGVSIDSSPQKPERKTSNKSLAHLVHITNVNHSFSNQTKKRSSSPPVRKVVRSESRLRPHLPTLTRRISIMDKDRTLSHLTKSET